MSSRNDEKGDAATNLSNSPKPQKSNSNSIPYPSPPNSPPQTPGVPGNENRPARAVSFSPLSPPTTPPKQSSAFTLDEKQPAEKRVNAATLRTRLGLDNKWCGAPAKTKRPCGKWSPAANRAGVTSQLESMIHLTQSSMELEAALDKLAKLVHCKSHDSGLPKKDRIEAWKETFPIGEASATNPTTLVEKRIRKVLVLESTQCIAVVDSADLRCERRIGGQRVNNCALTIDKIVNPDMYLNHSYLEGLLKVLETNMYCCQHINEQPLQKVASWKSSIVEILEEHLTKLAETGAPEETGGPSGAQNTQGPSASPSTRRSDEIESRSESLSTLNFDRDLSTYWPATYNTSPFVIIVKSDRLDDYKSSYDIVKREMTRELHEKDQRDGHVYMYEVEGNPGFVKIGYTTRSVEERLQEWDFDCNRAPKSLYPIPSSTAAAIPNARRVEALCHAELDHRRIRIECDRCLKPHLEWFEIPSTEAIAVIQKWSNWMATRPYRSIQFRHKVKWILREEETKRARDIDRFMREISGASR
ncbi:uncharacterized protein FTOL_03726 [Fusarium torulosum]|uniref:Bacteriophage T5 Orf172 DNA-binding domain-containing protein n=1 Tax=Fusarium torulosum TaxID=33205 RepID=A0AAE8SFU9_9HYPO|nr:uncharacterized protein FTOL_03726 [Fusarium torulosum]